jgi:hypothetical protein
VEELIYAAISKTKADLSSEFGKKLSETQKQAKIAAAEAANRAREDVLRSLGGDVSPQVAERIISEGQSSLIRATEQAELEELRAYAEQHRAAEARTATIQHNMALLSDAGLTIQEVPADVLGDPNDPQGFPHRFAAYLARERKSALAKAAVEAKAKLEAEKAEADKQAGVRTVAPTTGPTGPAQGTLERLAQEMKDAAAHGTPAEKKAARDAYIGAALAAAQS